MTNYRKPFIWSLILMILTLGMDVFSKPMDAEASKDIPQFKKIIGALLSKQSLSQEDLTLLNHGIESNDPVLISLVAWCLPRMEKETDLLYDALDRKLPSLSGMPKALVLLGKEKKCFKDKPIPEKVIVLKKMIESENEYLRIESAKELARISPKEAISAFKGLLNDPSPQVRSQVIDSLKILDKESVQRILDYPPIADERYILFLSITREKPDFHD